jgi:hypothetical protein
MPAAYASPTDTLVSGAVSRFRPNRRPQLSAGLLRVANMHHGGPAVDALKPDVPVADRLADRTGRRPAQATPGRILPERTARGHVRGDHAEDDQRDDRADRRDQYARPG